MGKASSTKKVARAARTGGGRTRRGASSSWVWPTAMAAIMVFGTAGVVLSKENRRTLHPTTNDHWHAALGLYVCGQFQPNLAQPAQLIGLHTHGDGLIHVEPVLGKDQGKSATLGRWLEGEPDMKLTPTELTIRGVTHKNGQKCGDAPARVQVKVGNRILKGDPRKLRIRNGQLITVAFVPPGTDIPEPPSKSNLSNPNAMEGQKPATPITTEPGQTSVPPTPPGSTPPGSTPPASTPPASTPPASGPAPPPATPAPPPPSAGPGAPPSAP